MGVYPYGAPTPEAYFGLPRPPKNTQKAPKNRVFASIGHPTGLASTARHAAFPRFLSKIAYSDIFFSCIDLNFA